MPIVLPASCPVELSKVPVLSTCPPDDAYVLLFNIKTDPSTVSFIPFSILKSCVFTNLKFVLNDFIIGNPGSLMNAGDVSFTITQPNVIQNSVFITMGGTELPISDGTQISYETSFALDGSGFTCLFNQGAMDGQQYILHYGYSI